MSSNKWICISNCFQYTCGLKAPKMQNHFLMGSNEGDFCLCNVLNEGVRFGGDIDKLIFMARQTKRESIIRILFRGSSDEDRAISYIFSPVSFKVKLLS